jgi:hypothetical protein
MSYLYWLSRLLRLLPRLNIVIIELPNISYTFTPAPHPRTEDIVEAVATRLD